MRGTLAKEPDSVKLLEFALSVSLMDLPTKGGKLLLKESVGVLIVVYLGFRFAPPQALRFRPLRGLPKPN